MKKVLLMALVLIMVLALVGCGVSPAAGESEPLESAESASQAPEPTETPEPKPTEAPSSWKKEYYVDEFGDTTDSAYLQSVVYGTFSNNATSGSDLRVCINYDQDENILWLRLIEYGSHVVDTDPSDTVTLKIKLDDGTVLTYELNTYDYTTDSFIDRGDISSLVDVLMQGEDFSCVLTVVKRYGNESRYRFDADGVGFAALAA